MSFDYDAARLQWHQQFVEYGERAVLRRPGPTGTDRPVLTMQASFTPQERQGRVTNPVDRKMIVSALDPDTLLPIADIDQRELLVTEDERLRQVAPPDRVGPNRKELYWSLAVSA